MGDGESVEGDLDPKKAEEEAIEAEKLAKVQAQVRAAMLASGGMPSPIVTSKATPAHKPSSLSKPAVESDNSDNDGGSDFDVPDGPAPVISEPPNMGTRTRRQSMTIPAAALSNILGNGKDGAGSPPAAAPQAPKIIEISVPIEPKVSPVTLSAARQQVCTCSADSMG